MKEQKFCVHCHDRLKQEKRELLFSKKDIEGEIQKISFMGPFAMSFIAITLAAWSISMLFIESAPGKNTSVSLLLICLLLGIVATYSIFRMNKYNKKIDEKVKLEKKLIEIEEREQK